MIPTPIAAALSPRYAIRRELGRGGMAMVYLADDVRHGRPVAIKTMLPEVAAAIGRERFLREIETAARLTHPNILPLFDSGEAEGHLWYVTPYIEGESLRRRLARDGAMATADAVRLIRGVAAALDHAHRQGVVHRDIKPENILISDGIALVADFGIARAMTADADSETSATRDVGLTGSGMTVGTPRYMAPEQFGRADVDGRADLYAMGCVLFEMLTGAPPFDGTTLAELMRAHLADTPRSIAESRPELDGAVAEATRRLLAKRPEERPATGSAFLALLESGMVSAASATPPAGLPPNNLPKERTSFIGREKDLGTAIRLLEETRLLTITGIGGCGKTRLALRLAREKLADFPDGSWFVDLAPLEDPEHVVSATATVLGAREVPGSSILDALIRHVGDRRLMVLLDNCEHMLTASAALADRLLADCPLVTIVATSREGLGVEGERPLSLRSLELPAPAERDAEVIGAAEAVRLFVERARVVDPAFAITPESAPVVADICRRLDGIPLALELAAARVKLLSVEEIRSRLDDRFRLLTGGSRTALPRQQTLHATLQWSHDQLSPTEQTLFRRLSVFAGGWTLAVATRVVDAGTDIDLMDGLTSLADKSLVVVEKRAGAESRYGFLETVRQFAQEHLAASGEAAGLRQRHLDAFIGIAEDAYRDRIDHEEERAALLESEHDNLRAALRTAQESDAAHFLRLAGSLAWFRHVRSHFIEARTNLEEALATTASPPPHPDRARALWGLAITLGWLGDGAAALPLMQEALAMRRAEGDAAEMVLALEGVGWAQLLAGNDDAALATFREFLDTTVAIGDPVLINRARVAVAQTLVALGHLPEARELSTEIIAFSRPRGDRRNEHFGIHFLADCDLIEQNFAGSLRRYRDSLALVWAIGDRLEASFEVQGTAMSLAGLGRPEAALRLAGAVEAEWERLGVEPHMGFWDRLLERYLWPAREACGATADAAWQRGREISFEAAVAEVLRGYEESEPRREESP